MHVETRQSLRRAVRRPMNGALDLNAYFARIGYTGAKSVSVDVLRALHALHPAAITFENIDVLFKRRISLDVATIADKILQRGRGGYCYEQNTLLMAALQSLGFAVRAVAGRVQWNMGELITARNHMVLLVSTAEGEFVADVGFGGLTMTAPLKFEMNTEQSTPHGRYRLVEAGDEFQVQARLDGQWRAMYQFALADEAPADWEMANWFVSTSPDSIFTNTLIVARPVNENRFALRNNRLRTYRADGTTELRQIESSKELVRVLRETFSLDLPPDGELAAVMSIAGL